jgi:hypothetical protein
MLKSPALASASLATVIAFAAPAQAANCRNGVCVSGRDNGSVVTVSYYVQNGPASHVNIRTPDGRQWEGSPRGSFNLQRFATTRYALQSCVRGTGLFGKSSCGAWANFFHNSSN